MIIGEVYVDDDLTTPGKEWEDLHPVITAAVTCNGFQTDGFPGNVKILGEVELTQEQINTAQAAVDGFLTE